MTSAIDEIVQTPKGESLVLWEVGEIGRFEVGRSKRRLSLKVSPGDTAAFDRWAMLFGFSLLYWLAMTFAPWWAAWLLVSWVGMYLLRGSSRKYARGVAAAESGFPRLREALEFESTEDVDFSGGAYRSAAPRTLFSSLTIDGRQFPLTAVKSLRLVKWRDAQSERIANGEATTRRRRFSALVVEVEDGGEIVPYEIDVFEGDARREALPLRNALASFCDVQPGKSVMLPDNQGLYGAPASQSGDNTILYIEVPVVAGLALLVEWMSDASSRALPNLAAFVVIVVIDLFRTSRLIDAEARARKAAGESLRGRSRKEATVVRQEREA